MKTITKIIAIGLLALATVTPVNADYADRNHLEFWERESYREGFLDGYDTAIYRNTYIGELDRIAYEIGFIDGMDTYDFRRKCWNKYRKQLIDF